VSDARVTEGDTGTKTIRFTVRLSKAWDQNVSVHFSTLKRSAHSPADFTATNGTLVFNPGGPLARKVVVKVAGDLVHERNETFLLKLGNALHGDIADPSGTATIVDDD
jgi:chitinase